MFPRIFIHKLLLIKFVTEKVDYNTKYKLTGVQCFAWSTEFYTVTIDEPA